MFEKKLNKQHKTILQSILGLSLLALLIFLGTYVTRAKEELDLVLSEFNSTNITLTSVGQLNKSFIQEDKNTFAEFEFELKNNSDYEYPISVNTILEGTLVTSEIESEMQQDIILAPEESKAIIVKFPVNQNDLARNSLLLKFNLEVAMTSSLLIPVERASLETEFLGNIAVIQSSEAVQTSITALEESRNLIYTRDNKPELKMNLNIRNLNSQAVSRGYYQINLVRAENNENVQILFAREIELSPLQDLKNSENFVFNMPPANQITPGENDYKIKLTYFTEVANELTSFESIGEEVIKIKVENI